MSSIIKPDLESFLRNRRLLIEGYLREALQVRPIAGRLWEAMAYSGLNGGKRLRGILAMATAEAISPSSWEKVLPIAAGIECIHSMSLIHDDLPCMDNADLRRGKASCHKAYDQATALLAGDALLVEGIRLCLQAQVRPEVLIRVSQLILEAVGADGMTGGQMIDLLETGKKRQSLQDLEAMHRLKTGAFLKASILTGAIVAGADQSQFAALTSYAGSLGLAFQIVDDLLDLEGDPELLGKQLGQDQASQKSTYLGLIGVKESRARAKEMIEEAKISLTQADILFEPLYMIADFVPDRKF